MASKLTEYFRLMLFSACLLAGLQVPAFVDQYHKSLIAHLSESELSLNAFQNDADKYFSGSLEELITHYLNSPDPVFNAGGHNIQQLYQRRATLVQALARFNQTAYSPYYYALIEPLADIQQEVWTHFTHTVVLNQVSIILGMACGIVPLLFLTICAQLFKAIRRLIGAAKLLSRQRHSHSTRS
ncbi:MAG: DUF2937 family protein [Porticoccaceae bacterium]|nr:DUF2937 family protein [Pseudomonadales bacterium]MCP5171488.1 DUF2937 family protein [Pseudomonadales bacterium]